MTAYNKRTEFNEMTCFIIVVIPGKEAKEPMENPEKNMNEGSFIKNHFYFKNTKSLNLN